MSNSCALQQSKVTRDTQKLVTENGPGSESFPSLPHLPIQPIDHWPECQLTSSAVNGFAHPGQKVGGWTSAAWLLQPPWLQMFLMLLLLLLLAGSRFI